MKTLLAYLIAICLSWSNALVAAGLDERVNKFALNQKWLGHFFFEKRFHGYESLVESSGYFLTQNGKSNPHAELSEVIRLLQSDSDLSTETYCRYISRFELVLTEFPEFKKTNHHCAAFEAWQNKLSINEVRLAFATGYIKNPASSFGHLFLKLVSKNKTDELLSYGINFSAQTGTEAGAIFALKGLFGLYPGGFVFLPYHQLIKDYSDLEGRDIWELNLELTNQEIRHLLTYVYEFNSNYIHYTFLNNNCAGILEKLIGNIKNQNFSDDRLLKPWAIPIESFQVIAAKQDSRHFRFQPSLKTQRQVMAETLSTSEMMKIKKQEVIKSYSDLSSRELDYILLDKKIDDDLSHTDYYYELLQARSKFPIAEIDLSQSIITDQSVLLDRQKSSVASISVSKQKMNLNLGVLSDKIIYGHSLSEISLLNVEVSNSRSNSKTVLSNIEFFSFMAGEAITFLRQPLSFGGGLSHSEDLGLNGEMSFGFIFDKKKFIYFPKIKNQVSEKQSIIFPEVDFYFLQQPINFKISVNPTLLRLTGQKFFGKKYFTSIGADYHMSILEIDGTISLGLFF